MPIRGAAIPLCLTQREFTMKKMTREAGKAVVGGGFVLSE
jgi:hypothetical protein